MALSPTLSPSGRGRQWVCSRLQPVPDALLDGIASQPDDPGVWEVLTDFLLEQDAPGATLARCDLELFRGISNPDLLGALSEARAKRPKLPFESYGGFDALTHPRLQWLAPDVVAWLENEESGVLTPLTPTTPHDGFEAPSFPALGRSLRRELLGWSRLGIAEDSRLVTGPLIEDGEQLALDGNVLRFHRR